MKGFFYVVPKDLEGLEEFCWPQLNSKECEERAFTDSVDALQSFRDDPEALYDQFDAMGIVYHRHFRWHDAVLENDGWRIGPMTELGTWDEVNPRSRQRGEAAQGWYTVHADRPYRGYPWR